MTDLKRLRELAMAASPGPWVSNTRYVGTPNHQSYIAECRDQNGNWTAEPMPLGNAAFIAAANPQTLLSLIDRIERLEGALKHIASLHHCADETEAVHYAKEALGE